MTSMLFDTLEPMDVEQKDSVKTALERYEDYYRGGFSVEEIESLIVDGKEINYRDPTNSGTCLHKCIGSIDDDRILQLLRRLLVKGAQTNLLKTHHNNLHLPQTAGALIVEYAYENTEHFDRCISVLLEMLYFGATKGDIYCGVDWSCRDKQIIEERLKPYQSYDLEDSDKRILDSLFDQIDKQKVRDALDSLDILNLKKHNSTILNSLLRLAIGRGLAQLIKPLIERGASLCLALPTIEGILLQAHLSEEKKIFYNNLLRDLSEFIRTFPSRRLWLELWDAIEVDDVRTFHFIKKLLPDFSYDIFSPNGYTVVHAMAQFNAHCIFKTVVKEIDQSALNVFTYDKYDETAVQLASFYGCSEMLDLLIQAGADPHKRSHESLEVGAQRISIGTTLTSYQRKLQVLRILLETGVDPADILVISAHTAGGGNSNYDAQAVMMAKLCQYGHKISDSTELNLFSRYWIVNNLIGLLFSGTLREILNNVIQEREKLTQVLCFAAGRGDESTVAFLLEKGAYPFRALPVVNNILKRPKQVLAVDKRLVYQHIKMILEEPLLASMNTYIKYLPQELLYLLFLYAAS